MNCLRLVLLTSCVSFAATVVAAGPAAAQAPQMCTMQYALCTSAPCVPVPGDHNSAICWCDVLTGANMTLNKGGNGCGQFKPTTDQYGVTTVYSAFSVEQFSSAKAMYCQAKKGEPASYSPVTNCLNAPCTVNPMQPSTAICTCPVIRGPDMWTTFGGKCDTKTCATGYWSGALTTTLQEGITFFEKNGHKVPQMQKCSGSSAPSK